MVLALACGDGNASSDAGDAGPTDGGLDMDAAGTDFAVTMDSGGNDASALDSGPNDAGADNPCKVAGGVCLAAADGCTGGGGTLLPGGDSGCVFDVGFTGVCCEPPAASSSGDSCQERGGLCTMIDGCRMVDGAFTAADPGCGFFVVCCVPETVCGPEEVECCDESGPASFRPNCDRGDFDCSHVPGTTLVPIGTCLI